MNDKERKDFINSIKENDLDKTASFSDLMSRSERKQYEKAKKQLEEMNKEENLKKKKKKKEKEVVEAKTKSKKEKKKDKKIKEEKIIEKENIKELEKTREYKNLVKEIDNKDKKNGFHSFMAFIILLASIGYLIYTISFGSDLINQYELIINAAIIFLISFSNAMGLTKKASKSWLSISSFFVVILIVFNLLTNMNILKVPTNNVVKDFTGININEAIKWADANKIKYYQVYEFSDNIEEFSIISQSVSPNTLTKSIKEIEFIVSKGPNYDKEVIISNMTNWNIDEVIEVIDDNFLSNVKIKYEFNDEIEKDIVISQNKSGQLKRNEEIEIVVSLGKKDKLKKVKAIDLTNYTEFKATLWLKRNGIEYEIKYDFSDTIKKGNVIKQSIEADKEIKPGDDKIIITLSKGAKIKVPNLKSMKVDEIISWVSSNNLKISFEERFDATVEYGNVIEANYKEGDEIEEGTKIKLITSKGVLKMKKFSSLADFRSWASKYGVNINEVFEFNDNIKQGDIIKFSHEEGSIINYNDTVTVYVSDGKAISVPDFYGKSKSNIQGTCNNLGLNCTFYYTRSNSTKDTAVAQNKRAGSKVIKGTYVNIGLSGGANYGVAPSNKCVANKSTTVYIYDELLSNVPATTCANIKNAYPNVKFSCTYATGTGMSPGLLVNSSSVDEKTFDNCTTVTLKISQN